MPDEPATIPCFHCSKPVGELNELQEGGNCPVCAERLLDALPPIFHEPWFVPYDHGHRRPGEEPPKEAS